MTIERYGEGKIVKELILVSRSIPWASVSIPDQCWSPNL